MSKRRQKNIEDTSSALRRALDRREELLAALVRTQRRIDVLVKRNNRARSAQSKGDASIAAGIAPSPYTTDRAIEGDLDDEIPNLGAMQ